MGSFAPGQKPGRRTGNDLEQQITIDHYLALLAARISWARGTERRSPVA